MADILWQPSPERIDSAQVSRFMAKVSAEQALELGNYAALHRWSIEEPAAFWQSLWDFCEVRASAPPQEILVDADRMPGARWFEGARLNFAENLLRRDDDGTAVISLLETGARRELSWRELRSRVQALASRLRRDGIQPGDRIAGFLPNIEETVVCMLAATSVGATWSSCSPDFGFNGVLDRFGQIAPKVLFAADGYYYNGKACDCTERITAIAGAIESLEQVVVIDLLAPGDRAGAHPLPDHATAFEDYLDADPLPLSFEQLPFDHPLYIMYSSGTTGVPKCILHGAGGTLLQHLKEHRLHADLREGDVFFYFTTCGWMMWNWLVSGLASGATLLLYDGSPFAQDGALLLDAIDSEGINIFGTSAKFIAALEKAGVKPAQGRSLASLRTILSTGSPLSPESFDYVYRDFKSDVCLSSISGGTDIISCFVGGCPILPVRRGEIQCAGLGMAVEIRNEDGEAVVGEKGELVCTRPFPSMPLGFWGDHDGARYRGAYFDNWPGVWAQGDYGEESPEGGFLIFGRSDAVLNPGGVRIGTAEIYRQVERVEEVLDSVVVGQEWGDDVRVVLAVVLAPGVQLDGALTERIKATIRRETTPRHVPAVIFQVREIPRTISGKVVELAVREVIHGRYVNNEDALANPEALEDFRDRPELRP